MSRFGVNGMRGEVTADMAGAPRRLCLTLGALAEIETALGVVGAGALAERLRHPSASDLSVVLAALLRGGGEMVLAAEVATAAITPVEAIEAVAATLAASIER